MLLLLSEMEKNVISDNYDPITICMISSNELIEPGSNTYFYNSRLPDNLRGGKYAVEIINH